MLDYEDYLKEFNNMPGLEKGRVAKTLPVELRGLPAIVYKLNDAFKNKNLNTVQHDLKRPAEIDPDMIGGSSLASMDPSYRSKIKVTGHRLLVVGDALKKFISDFFHGNDYMMPPKPIDNVELVTTAHPELVKMIVQQGIKDHILPPNTKLDNDTKSDCIVLKVPADGKDEKKDGVKQKGGMEVRIHTTRKAMSPDTLGPETKSKGGDKPGFGSLEDDAALRGRDNAMYYDLDKKSILDYGLGIYGLQSKPLKDAKEKSAAKPVAKKPKKEKK